MSRYRQTITLSPTDAEGLSNLKESLQLGTQAKLCLTEEPIDIEAFTQWLTGVPAGFLTKLSMPVSLEMLHQPAFHALLEMLVTKAPEVLELDVGAIDSNETETALIDNIVPLVNFPVQIKNKTLAGFERAMIKNLQSKPGPTIVVEEFTESDNPSVPGKKIRLKALMQAKTDVAQEEFKQFVTIDVEHVEAVEQQIVVEEEVQAEYVEQEITPYEGELIDYQAFDSDTYRAIARANFGDAPLDAAYALIQHELFANLPQSIKYLSPLAAKKLAANLLHWAAMNKDNCAPFVLRQTGAQEFVLDYDGDENENNTAFSLHTFSPYEAIEPYYDAVITPPNPHVAALLFDDGNHNTKLSNLWIRHGDKGILHFYNALKQLDEQHEDLADFLVHHYLNHFAHWEPFYNEAFFDTLRKLEDYSPLQLRCLRRFLVNTGCSQHDLSKTLEEFDIFWRKFATLCENNEALMQKLDTNWSTPTGGLPSVYMQRLLAILERARKLSGQLESLDGIVLSQYGAYYASRYEGFTEVHPAMGFVYRPDVQFNARAFNPHFTLYRVTIDALEYEAKKSRKMSFGAKNTWVIPKLGKKELHTPLEQIKNKINFIDYLRQEEDLPPGYCLYYPDREGKPYPQKYEGDGSIPMTMKSFAQLTHRYIGQQLAGISVQSFIANLALSKESIKSYNISDTSPDIGSFRSCLLQTLLFITSDRYNDAHLITMQDLMECTDPGDFHRMDEVNTTIARLKQLQANHVNFDVEETVFYQNLQNIGVEPRLPPEKRVDFFFTRVEGLPARFEEHKAWNQQEYGEKHTKKSAWVHWLQEAQDDFRARLHHRLLNNKPAALKFINLAGAYHAEKHQAWLYAFNTEEFFAEIPQVAQCYRDDLLAFSAQLCNDALNLVPSDFTNVLKTCDTDIIQLREIRDYLYRSTLEDPLQNYFYYTIQRLIDTNELFTYEQVLAVFNAVSQLDSTVEQLDTSAVHAILQRYDIPVCVKLLHTLHHDDNYIKNELKSIIVLLELGAPDANDEEQLKQFEKKSTELMPELANLSFPALQERFTKNLPTCSMATRSVVTARLKTLLKSIVHKHVTDLFAASNKALPELTQYWIQVLYHLGDLQDYDDFVAVGKIVGKLEPVALLFHAIIRNPAIAEHQQAVVALFSKIDFARMDSEQVHFWLDFLGRMPQRNYLPLLTAMANHPEIIYQKAAFKALIHALIKLHEAAFSTQAMVNFYQRFVTAPSVREGEHDHFISQLTFHFTQNNQDPLVALCLDAPGFSLPQVMAISEDTHRFNLHREQVANLYQHMQRQNQLDTFLRLNAHADTNSLVLNILALADSARLPSDPEVDLLYVAQQLLALTPEQLNALNTHYDSTLTSICCLSNALNNFKKEDSFNDFLDFIEKSPFGLRDLDAQFSVEEVERVVNSSLDLQSNQPYSRQYRRQLMETFLLVNDLGRTLPMFNQKPVRELSNAEIKDFFARLKANTDGYNSTQRRILALSILREAMYRATGQFPFSTQMIGLIDCMLHRSDVIINIDTGQGKSLIDVMKLAFLYLESDRVDMSTSTLIDAARDIDNYSSFLSLLGIPFAKKPITANTPLADFCLDGVNFSISSQLALRFSKALAANENIDPPGRRVSWVLNESDTLLDDRAIKRLASSPEVNISKKHPWIYEAINAFVMQNSFRHSDTSAAEDARRLRRYLMEQARQQGKPQLFIKELVDDTLITWIESAILVNYNLRENFDYVVLPVPEKNNKFFARILMNDARPSQDSVFGKGMQQLLHARLNQDERFKDHIEEAFEITPENRTIISTDNRTLVDYYRARKGFIWGSSGTVGSEREIEEQAEKYGFAFSKIEPHQKKQVTEKSLVIVKGKEAHYQRLVDELRKRRNNPLPLVIFCENIDKAKEIYAYIVDKLGAENIQLNTGINDMDAERELIKNAARPGMCTISTAAIGRNTDIPYDKSSGLDIWLTSIASTRLDMQKKGRTGRQGSPGEIACFLNEDDQQIRTPQDVAALRAALDAAGRKERDYHESLYRVIGFFLTQLEQLPSAAFTAISKRTFIYQHWADFSEHLEQRYRELVLKNAFDRQAFFDEAKLEFIRLLQQAIPDYEPIDWKLDDRVFQVQTHAEPYTRPVSISECSPAIDIAYDLFHQQLPAKQAEKLAKEQEDALQQELQTLFSSPEYNANQHARFFNKLMENEVARDKLAHLYQHGLHNFLTTSQPCGFFMRWLGFNTPLNQLADNRHYLVLFRAIASVSPDKPIVDANEIKQLATAMIEEYLQNSWWISHEKRTAAITLQQEILASPDIDSAMQAICASQIAIAEKDIASNKNRFGDSRLQNTLSNVLTLAATLGVQTNTDALVTKFTQDLNELTADESNEPLSIASLEQKAKTSKGNASVLIRSLSKALQLGEHKSHCLPGMEGRSQLRI